MKTFPILVAICMAALSAQSQKITRKAIAKLPPDSMLRATELMCQANSAKLASIAMSAGGGVMAIIGLVVNESADKEYYYDESTGSAGTTLFITGSAIALSSLIFTIIKRMKYNKVKAMLNAQPAVSLSPQLSLPGTQSYGLKIIIPLGK